MEHVQVLPFLNFQSHLLKQPFKNKNRYSMNLALQITPMAFLAYSSQAVTKHFLEQNECNFILH